MMLLRSKLYLSLKKNKDQSCYFLFNFFCLGKKCIVNWRKRFLYLLKGLVNQCPENRKIVLGI